MERMRERYSEKEREREREIERDKERELKIKILVGTVSLAPYTNTDTDMTVRLASGSTILVSYWHRLTSNFQTIVNYYIIFFLVCRHDNMGTGLRDSKCSARDFHTAREEHTRWPSHPRHSHQQQKIH
jgi:hypothetical protein